MDFSKAFDEVPHQRLISKLHFFYGTQNSNLNWISSFLTNRTQQVTIDNIQSDQLILVFLKELCLVPFCFFLL